MPSEYLHVYGMSVLYLLMAHCMGKLLVNAFCRIGCPHHLVQGVKKVRMINVVFVKTLLLIYIVSVATRNIPSSFAYQNFHKWS